MYFDVSVETLQNEFNGESRYFIFQNYMKIGLMKRCTNCTIYKPLNMYGGQCAGKFGVTSVCKECRSIISKEFRSSNKEVSDKRLRKSHLKNNYGISLVELEELLNSQSNRCCICRNTLKEKYSIDHCHKTGKIRGVLCFRCNSGLGLFKDDIELLKIAIRYLEDSK